MWRSCFTTHSRDHLVILDCRSLLGWRFWDFLIAFLYHVDRFNCFFFSGLYHENRGTKCYAPWWPAPHSIFWTPLEWPNDRIEMFRTYCEWMDTYRTLVGLPGTARDGIKDKNSWSFRWENWVTEKYCFFWIASRKWSVVEIAASLQDLRNPYLWGKCLL